MRERFGEAERVFSQLYQVFSTLNLELVQISEEKGFKRCRLNSDFSQKPIILKVQLSKNKLNPLD